jgi:hypothetical protein
MYYDYEIKGANLNWNVPNGEKWTFFPKITFTNWKKLSEKVEIEYKA